LIYLHLADEVTDPDVLGELSDAISCCAHP
jgi:hypothetical protein